MTFGYLVRRPASGLTSPNPVQGEPAIADKGAWIAGFLVVIDAEAHARISSGRQSRQPIEVWDMTRDPVVISRWQGGERLYDR